ncbi:hypothetical protein BFR47_09300 [Oceanisphaera psychrotolerans]|uniref:Uncharacterized protein n=1 Tax=Oceanisphaera psychrotolerans TaxID=1414654 RepID=A0A1J4QHC7_9GAMM|nr:hypothetical protein BFR47_09300 [Oceanisphaera psychrotolerans]
MVGFKIDIENGFSYDGYEDPATGVVFKLTGGSNKTFDWSIHEGLVHEVAVAGGSSTHVFNYSPPVEKGEGLYAPDNKGGNRAGVSHVAFCYDPVKAKIEVSKVCTAQDITETYDGFIATNTVVVTNAGNVTLGDIALKETLDNCKVTKINGDPINPKIALTKGEFVPVDNLDLNKDESATLIVRCRTDEPNLKNTIYARGETSLGTKVSDSAESDPYSQCKFVHKTRVKVEKTCVENSVHLQSLSTDLGDLLAVRVCPSIVIYNKSTEPLKYIRVHDESIDLLAGEGGYTLDNAILYPGKEINLSEWINSYDPDSKGKLCYYPDVPRGHDRNSLHPLNEALQDFYDPNSTAFFNQVRVEAKGKWSKTPVEDSDSTYSWDEINNEWVAECPLCTCQGEECDAQATE